MTLSDIWQQSQSLIKEKVGHATYDTWFSSLKIKEENEETVIVETPDEFYKTWIVDHYRDVVEESVSQVASPKSVFIKFAVNSNLFQEDTPSRLAQFERKVESLSDIKRAAANLNPRFSFDNFVIGSSNRFAAAASLAVAEAPAKAYNPLFIYGPVGLGKTHLMQAIAQKIKSLHPDIRCNYLSSESFTNELINAIRHKATPQFREKYRNIDVLMIDDIHFIAGKEATQEEFFHTFNALHNNRKQIIICSDRPPKEIAKLEERLSSRFAWGLVADIQPPDFETRMAILRKKIERESVTVPNDVISFIAEQIRTNIRELEGALIRVVAYSLLEERTISLEMTKVVLSDMVKETEKIITVEMIQKKVASFFHVLVSDLKSKRRNKNVILPRQVAMYLTRRLSTLSLPEIGNAFGGKDHTTVLHSCKKIDRELHTNGELKNILDSLTTGLKQ